MVSRLACASAGTRKWQRATEFTHSSRMFLNRFPPIQTLQWIDPGAGANVIRATSSKGCAARGGLGATESTSMRTSPVALCADDGSVVAAANTTAVNAASQLIMRFRVRSKSRGRQSPRPFDRRCDLAAGRARTGLRAPCGCSRPASPSACSRSLDPCFRGATRGPRSNVEPDAPTRLVGGRTELPATTGLSPACQMCVG